MSRVAVFGASGFVGATFVERLLARRTHEPKALIHTTGSAWRLSRHAIPLHVVDVLDAEAVRRELADCSHVVNCSRGPDDVMLRGLRNLLAASAAAGVRRFVHVSSIALYGQQSVGALLDDDARPNSVRGQYGWLKLRQDRMVAAAARRGMQCVVVCPAHVFGAYSQFLTSCVNALRAGRLALVEGGSLPASYVDVSNLCQALEQALSCAEADGRRIVLEDGQKLTWLDVVTALAPLAEREPPFPMIDLESARRIAEASVPRPSLAGSARRLAAHLTSPAFRELVKGDPLLGGAAAKALRALRVHAPRLAARLVGSAPTAAAEPAPAWDAWSARAQSLSVRFSGERARRVLGFAPERSFAQSMAAFGAWYRATHGFGSADWPLLRELWT